MDAHVDKQARAKAGLDGAVNGQARRQAAAVRTAWIIGAIVLALFIASLVQGHFVGIPNWVPPH